MKQDILHIITNRMCGHSAENMKGEKMWSCRGIVPVEQIAVYTVKQIAELVQGQYGYDRFVEKMREAE